MSDGQYWRGTSQAYLGDEQSSSLSPGTTVNKSCDLCSAKKRKCDGGNPCSRCARRGEGHRCSYSLRRPYTQRRGSGVSVAVQPSVGQTTDGTPSLQPNVPGRLQESAASAFQHSGVRAQTGSAESFSMPMSNTATSLAWNMSGASMMGGSRGGQGHLSGLVPGAAAYGHPTNYAVATTSSGGYPSAGWTSQNSGAPGCDSGMAQSMVFHHSGAGPYDSYLGGGASASNNVATTSVPTANYLQWNNAAAMAEGDDDVAEEDWLEATKAFLNCEDEGRSGGFR